jgi:hypothetical protein
MSKEPYIDKYGRTYYTHPQRKNLGLCNLIPEIRPHGISLRNSIRHRFWKICWNNTLTTFRFGGLTGFSKENAYWEAVLHLSKLHFESAMKLRRSQELSPDEEYMLGELVDLNEDTDFDLHVAEDPHPFEVIDDFEVDFILFDEFLKDYANFDI